MLHVATVRFSHILETNDLAGLTYFFSHTAFVISHKSESVETLLGVLWYLPAGSPIIVVTNCPEEEIENIKQGLSEQLPHHTQVYLVHQKDERVASLFRRVGVHQILGNDGKVVNGKGEGMYIGTLCALQLGYPQWVIFYDADNFVPSALLEYTLAMSRLFRSPWAHVSSQDALLVGEHVGAAPDWHAVRICWASKPTLGSSTPHARVVGRCTQVVSPLFRALLEECFGLPNAAIASSNAGEQGMTMRTAAALRFSSGFSVETFQLLDFLFQAQAGSAILQQYQARSPHFHEKKGDEHITQMIAESLGSFVHFEGWLPGKVKRHLQEVYDDLGLEWMVPRVYPSLHALDIGSDEAFVSQYRLGERETALAIV